MCELCERLYDDASEFHEFKPPARPPHGLLINKGRARGLVGIWQDPTDPQARRRRNSQTTGRRLDARVLRGPSALQKQPVVTLVLCPLSTLKYLACKATNFEIFVWGDDNFFKIDTHSTRIHTHVRENGKMKKIDHPSFLQANDYLFCPPSGPRSLSCLERGFAFS